MMNRKSLPWLGLAVLLAVMNVPEILWRATSYFKVNWIVDGAIGTITDLVWPVVAFLLIATFQPKLTRIAWHYFTAVIFLAGFFNFDYAWGNHIGEFNSLVRLTGEMTYFACKVFAIAAGVGSFIYLKNNFK